MSHETYRIARFLARCGVASRRKAEDLVRAGAVKVNGTPVTQVAWNIDPVNDVVEYDGRVLRLPTEHVTLAFNKPLRVMVSRGDTHERRTIYDMLPLDWASQADKLIYVGRLDYMSQGLILMTTDGELAHRMMHPRRHVEKEYHIWLDRELTAGEMRELEAGVEIEGTATLPCTVRALGRKKGEQSYAVTLIEGRNRQVRKMIESVGAKVQRLVRVRIGMLELGDLPTGEWMELTEAEIEKAQISLQDEL